MLLIRVHLCTLHPSALVVSRCSVEPLIIGQCAALYLQHWLHESHRQLSALHTGATSLLFGTCVQWLTEACHVGTVFLSSGKVFPWQCARSGYGGSPERERESSDMYITQSCTKKRKMEEEIATIERASILSGIYATVLVCIQVVKWYIYIHMCECVYKYFHLHMACGEMACYPVVISFRQLVIHARGGHPRHL